MGLAVSVTTPYRTLDDEMRRCRRCAVAFAKGPIDPRKNLVDVEPRPVVFLPHASGASRWLKSPGNRQLLQQAKTFLRVASIERGFTT